MLCCAARQAGIGLESFLYVFRDAEASARASLPPYALPLPSAQTFLFPTGTVLFAVVWPSLQGFGL